MKDSEGTVTEGRRTKCSTGDALVIVFEDTDRKPHGEISSQQI